MMVQVLSENVDQVPHQLVLTASPGLASTLQVLKCLPLAAKGSPDIKKNGNNVVLGEGGHRLYLFLAQIYQGLKLPRNGLCTLTNLAQHVIFVHTCQQGGLMCRIWDWQATIVKDLNNSQDPKHKLFCRENTLSQFMHFFQTTNVPKFSFHDGL